MRAIVLFAILASFLLLLGCASQAQPPQPPAQQPSGPAAGTPKAPAAQPQQQATEPSEPEMNSSGEDMQQELDAQDAGVQESITDMDSLQ